MGFWKISKDGDFHSFGSMYSLFNFSRSVEKDDANPANIGMIGLVESVKSALMAAPLLSQTVAKIFISHRWTRIPPINDVNGCRSISPRVGSCAYPRQSGVSGM